MLYKCRYKKKHTVQEIFIDSSTILIFAELILLTIYGDVNVIIK